MTMQTTIIDDRNPTGRTDVLAYRINDAIRVTGIGRTKLYELIGSGAFRTMKIGKRTLICAVSLRQYLAERPAAVIRAGR
jgi:predicted DNA-binding transcriptional regulator AlpA